MYICCLPICSRQFEHESGKCIICQELCMTKGCKCSYLHKECAALLYEKKQFKCLLCNRNYSTNCLQKIPEQNEKEKEEEILIYKKYKQSIIKKNHEIEKNFKVIVPYIIQSYNTTSHLDIEIVLEDICTDASVENSLYQRFLDDGHKHEDAISLLKYIKQIHAIYDVSHPSTKKKLQNLLNSKKIRSKLKRTIQYRF